MQTYRVEMLLLLVATVIVSQSTGQPLEYLCSNSSTNTSNYQVTLLLNIHYGPDCSQRNPRWQNSTLAPQVLKWQAKLPTEIGFNIVDTCGDSDVSAKAIAEIIPYSWTSAASSISFCASSERTPINIGFITEILPTGYDTESRLLGQAEVPLILTSDDIINSKSSDQSSVIAVGDKLQTKLEMMNKLMVEMEWDFVTVVYSDDAIGRLSVELFQNISLKYYICIDKSVAASYTSSPADINTVGVVLLGSEGIGLHLLGQLTPSPKVWVTGHDISGLAINNGVKVYSVVGESGSQLVINSLVSFSKALEEAENKPDCSSAGSAQCASKQQFRHSLKDKLLANINSKFSHSMDNLGDVQSVPASTDTIYKVYFHKESISQVATILRNDSISFSGDFNPVPSLCLGAKCRVQCREFNENQFTYIHGKWVIVLFLPIHETADPKDPWSCVNFTITKVFRTEAAVYALNYLKAKLDDDRFGLLILDSCGYRLKPAGTLFDIIRGTQKICNHLGQCFDPETIVQYVGDFSSAVTQQIQTVTREMPAIQMSYGASSDALNDREDYPYFLRTNPADDLQAHFMVELLKSLDKRSTESRINAVNILYTDGLYGRTGAERVKEALAKAGICVHLDSKVNVTATDNNFEALVEDLLYKTGDVKITVVFLDPEHITVFMKTIQMEAYRSTWKNTGLSFILSDTWNVDPGLLADYGDLMKGSFSFKIESNFNSTSFQNYLKNVDVPSSVNNRNFWLSTLVQEVGKCKIRGNFHSTYHNKCYSASANLTALDGESYASHTMKAITSTVYGIRSIAFDRKEKFLFEPSTILERYRLMLRIGIPTTLEDDSRLHNPFTAKGNGKVGYSIYNLKLDEVSNQPTYRLVLHTGYTLNDTLGKFEKVPQFYDGSPRPSSDIKSTKVGNCEIAVTSLESITPDTSTADDANSLSVPLIVVATLLAVLMIALILLFLWFRQKIQNRPQAVDNKHDDKGLCHTYESGGDYADIPYEHYLTSPQRERILQFVRETPETVPSPRVLTLTPSAAEYHVPSNNRPIKESTGADNSAFSGSEASGPSYWTAGKGSVASESTSGVVKTAGAEARDTLPRPKVDAPVPIPRSTPNSYVCSKPAVTAVCSDSDPEE